MSDYAGVYRAVVKSPCGCMHYINFVETHFHPEAKSVKEIVLKVHPTPMAISDKCSCKHYMQDGLFADQQRSTTYNTDETVRIWEKFGENEWDPTAYIDKEIADLEKKVSQ